jgi:Arc/MetJ-type ribon-helix-helix transcriptional regulator
MATEIEKKDKVTLQLPESLLVKAKALVRSGRYRSLASFIRQSIEEELKRAEREQLRRDLEAASRDPLFLADVREISSDFAQMDLEALRQDA